VAEPDRLRELGRIDDCLMAMLVSPEDGAASTLIAWPVIPAAAVPARNTASGGDLGGLHQPAAGGLSR